MQSFRHFTNLLIQQLRVKLEYPSDFMLQLLAMVIRQSVWLAFVSVIFLKVPQVGGWGFWEVAFLYGLTTVPLGLNELLLDGSWQLPSLVKSGEFDRILILPFDPVLQVFSQVTNMHGLGNVAVGLAVMIWAGPHLEVVWTIWTITVLIVAAVSGMIIYASVTLATASLSFWTTDIGSSVPFMVNQLADFARFPLSLYPPFISGLLTWIFPFAFAGFLPVSFLLGFQPIWVVIGSPCAACMAFLTARVVFNLGVRRYESTGH